MGDIGTGWSYSIARTYSLGVNTPPEALPGQCRTISSGRFQKLFSISTQQLPAGMSIAADADGTAAASQPAAAAKPVPVLAPLLSNFGACNGYSTAGPSNGWAHPTSGSLNSGSGFSAAVQVDGYSSGNSRSTSTAAGPSNGHLSAGEDAGYSISSGQVNSYSAPAGLRGASGGPSAAQSPQLGVLERMMAADDMSPAELALIQALHASLALVHVDHRHAQFSHIDTCICS